MRFFFPLNRATAPVDYYFVLFIVYHNGTIWAFSHLLCFLSLLFIAFSSQLLLNCFDSQFTFSFLFWSAISVIVIRTFCLPPVRLNIVKFCALNHNIKKNL